MDNRLVISIYLLTITGFFGYVLYTSHKVETDTSAVSEKDLSYLYKVVEHYKDNQPLATKVNDAIKDDVVTWEEYYQIIAEIKNQKPIKYDVTITNE
jgi:hypothetical protein